MIISKIRTAFVLGQVKHETIQLYLNTLRMPDRVDQSGSEPNADPHSATAAAD
jgi:hypothetical protein